MREFTYGRLLALTVGLVVVASFAAAQPAANGQTAKWSMDTAVLNTAAQAWDLAGRNNEQFGEMVQGMVGLVASNRGLQIPNNKDAGSRIGTLIARDVKADPDALLYAIVDHAVTTSLCRSGSIVMPTSMQQVDKGSLGDVVTSTVSQAWTNSGQSREEFAKMVNQITALVMQNRGLTLADTKEAGQQFGHILSVDMEEHPNDLLYSVVERSLRQASCPAPITPATPAQ